MRLPFAFAGVLALLCAHGKARALDPTIAPTQYVHQSWAEPDGLPQNAAMSLGQTRDGFVWIGTEEGIARFDGRKFEVWDRSAHRTLDSSAVRALYVARDDTVWFGTYDGVVCAIRHRVVDECLGADQGLPREFVRSILVDDDGTLWVATSAGLFARRDGRFRQVLPGRVLSLAMSDQVLAATDHGLWKWDGSRGSIVAFASQLVTSVYVAPNRRVFVGLTEGVHEVLTTGPVAVADSVTQRLTVRAMSLDRDGSLWLGAGNGVYRCRGSTCLGTDPGKAVYSVLVDSDGQVWYGTAFSGVHLLSNPTILSVGREEGFDVGPTGGAAVASDNTVWIATHGRGVVHARLDGTVLRVIQEWRATDGLQTDDVDGIAIDPSGVVWIASTRGFSAIDQEQLHVPPPSEQAPGVSWHLISRRGSDGKVFGWAVGRGLVEMEGHELRWWQDPQGLGNASVRGVYAALDGSFWIGTANELLHVVGSSSSSRVTERFPLAGALAFYEDQELGFLSGTMSRGLALRDGDEFRSFGRADGLPSNLLFSLGADLNGDIWGAFNGGLALLPRRSLLAIKAGGQTLVGGGRFGLVEGLRAGECNSGQPARFANGWLLFPTVEGVAIVRSTRARMAPPHALRVDGTQIDDIRVPFGVWAQLPPGDHQLRVKFTAAYFAHADEVLIRTRLRGVEGAWRDVGEGRDVRYARLPPGDYVLDAEAWWHGERVPGPDVSVSFRVLPHWTQTWWFRVLIAVGVLLALLGVYRARTGVLKAQARALERTVRERTAQLEERTQSLDRALTELKDAQAEVIRAEREASIATLVQGVAHELNNPINFLTANIAPLRNYAAHLAKIATELRDGKTRSQAEIEELSRFSPKKDLNFVLTDLDALLKDVDEGARRAKIIVADLQNLKSSTSRSLVRVDLGKAAEQTLRLASPRILSTHRVHMDIADGLIVTARAGHVEQVLSNLVDNALRAMPEGGDLYVSVAREEKHVVLSVRDTGVGMDETTRARCLEPFFTTRPAGVGTGLGLALVASMVAAADGTLEIQSEVGQGTTMLARFPSDNAQK